MMVNTSSKRNATLLFTLLATLTLVPPSGAQVESVAAKTKGLSCGVCGAIVELYLRRVPGIDRISMSMSKEILKVTYKEGGTFQPEAIRDALRKSQVEVLQFQISAKGEVREFGGQQFLIAGSDRFLLAPSPSSPKPPLNVPVRVEGIVNERASPKQLTILSVKSLLLNSAASLARPGPALP